LGSLKATELLLVLLLSLLLLLLLLLVVVVVVVVVVVAAAAAVVHAYTLLFCFRPQIKLLYSFLIYHQVVYPHRIILC
jgi:hypothetical protein